MCDLLTEAKYAEKLKSNPDHGPALMSFVWGGIFVAQLCSYLSVGAVLGISTYSLYIFCLPLALTIIYPLMKNWLGEEIPAHPPCCGVAEEKLKKESKLFSLSILMGGISITLALLGMFDENPTVRMVLPIFIVIAAITGNTRHTHTCISTYFTCTQILH